VARFEYQRLTEITYLKYLPQKRKRRELTSSGKSESQLGEKCILILVLG